MHRATPSIRHDRASGTAPIIRIRACRGLAVTLCSAARSDSPSAAESGRVTVSVHCGGGRWSLPGRQGTGLGAGRVRCRTGTGRCARQAVKAWSPRSRRCQDRGRMPACRAGDVLAEDLGDLVAELAQQHARLGGNLHREAVLFMLAGPQFAERCQWGVHDALGLWAHGGYGPAVALASAHRRHRAGVPGLLRPGQAPMPGLAADDAAATRGYGGSVASERGPDAGSGRRPHGRGWAAAIACQFRRRARDYPGA
jgi:hypothetical protein